MRTINTIHRQSSLISFILIVLWNVSAFSTTTAFTTKRRTVELPRHNAYFKTRSIRNVPQSSSSVSLVNNLYRRTHIQAPTPSLQRQASSSSLYSTSKTSHHCSYNNNNNNTRFTPWFPLHIQQTLFKSKTHYHPILQLFILIIVYLFHLTVLTQHSIVFPFQFIPNPKGHFSSIGWDSLAGILVFLSYGLYCKNPTPWSTVSYDSITSPFTFPSPPSYTTNNNNNTNNNSTTSIISNPTLPLSLHQVAKASSVVTLFLLTLAYFATGRIASFLELSLYSLAGLGFPLTIPMHRSLVVLGGHVAWVLMGSLLLSLLVQPQPFFPLFHPKNNKKQEPRSMYKWYTSNFWNTNWLWWTLGGYIVSSWFFNIADGINQYLLPKQVFELASEGVVSQLINPENNDVWASIVGYIAPCISAPWWEEVLYRGFLLPALCLFMNFWMAVGMSGILFSIHHLSTTGAIPLAVLGVTWATLYAKSGNLMVTILIHACWNSRVFLGSWFGL